MVGIECRPNNQANLASSEHIEFQQRFSGYDFGHYHWGYQPYREYTIQLPNGDIHPVFDISGSKDRALFIWNNFDKPVQGGFNALITEECHRPLCRGDQYHSEPKFGPVLHLQEFGFQLSPSYLDWLIGYDPGLYAEIKNILWDKPEFATTLTQHILPLLPNRIAEMLIETGIQAYHDDFPGRPGPFGFWPAELAIADGTADDEGTIDILARHGIRVVILAEDQLADDRPDAPFYDVVTNRGTHMYVLPYSRALSGPYGFEHLSADTFAGRVADMRRVEGISPFGANDLETFTEAKGPGYLEFAYWLYAEYFPKLRAEGRVSWQRNITMAQPTTLKPGRTSWSCTHGHGRWNGAPECNCDGSTAEIQSEKRLLYGGLIGELYEVVGELDWIANNDGLGGGWENRYIDWQLAIRKDVAQGKVISAHQVPHEYVVPFLRLHTILMGLQSCAFFFRKDFERQMARGSLAEAEILRKL